MRINKIRELSHNVIIVVVLRVAKVERATLALLLRTRNMMHGKSRAPERERAASYFCAEGFFRLSATAAHALIYLFVCVCARSLAQSSQMKCIKYGYIEKRASA